jgi:hypothetical protein
MSFVAARKSSSQRCEETIRLFWRIAGQISLNRFSANDARYLPKALRWPGAVKVA